MVPQDQLALHAPDPLLRQVLHAPDPRLRQVPHAPDPLLLQVLRAPDPLLRQVLRALSCHHACLYQPVLLVQPQIESRLRHSLPTLL